MIVVDASVLIEALLQTPAAEAMHLANAASGVVVLEHGAAVCTIDALDKALTGTVAPVT